MLSTTLSASRLWRQRLLVLRGVLIVILALAFMAAWLHAQSPMPAITVTAWLTLLWLPSLLYLPTRRQGEARQRLWLALELALDILLFIGFLYQLGGAGNPIIFYLLLPVLVASLSLHPGSNAAIALLAVTCYGSTSLWQGGHPGHHHLHGLHDISRTHELGMWIIFTVLALVFSLLGQALQRAARQGRQQQATALGVALQRERMYQIAADLADRAHELNTPLATMMLITEETPPSSPAQLAEDWQQLHALCLRMSGILKAQPQTEEGTAPLSTLTERLRRNLGILAPTLTVRWHGPADPRLGPVHAWQRILANLGYNACDAGATQIDVRCEADVNHWIIQIADNGPQQAATDKEHQGLGLGLTLVETTLATLGGELELLTESRWTVARLRLPRPTTEIP